MAAFCDAALGSMTVASEDAREVPRFKICWGLTDFCGDDTGDPWLTGCERFTVAKSRAWTGPFPVAWVTLFLEDLATDALGKSVF